MSRSGLLSFAFPRFLLLLLLGISSGFGSLAPNISAVSTCFAAESVPSETPETTVADRALLQNPILFAKRYNYQGLHIYDTFYQWRPGGGIYVLENPADPPEQHRIRAIIDEGTPETLGPGIYFDPSLSYDAQTILFCFKGSSSGNSVIYEIGVDGKGLRQITNLDNNGNPYKGSGGGHHDVKPCYLPDDRILFCSTRYSGLVPCANNGVTILHVMNRDGSNIHTISVNNVTEFDPVVMPDGRILFGRWEYIDKNALTIQSLWTVYPDGTNETALFANNMVFPEAVLQAKPVPGAEHLIVSTFAPHNAPPRGTIAMIDTRLGKNEEQAICNFETPDRPTYDRGDSCDPWALNENVVLYSGVPESRRAPKIGNDTPAGNRGNPKLNAIQLIDRTGKKVLILSDPLFDLHNPIPLVPREKPRIITDMTDRNKITGNFFVHDVYEGMPEVPRGSLKWLRVVEETSRVSESPGGTWMNQTFSISAALAWSPKIYHGVVPIEEDGSVFFEAPSGRSLNFQLLDKDYRLVRSMRTFIQAAPGTTRSCMGCHEYKYGTTPSVAASRLLGRQPKSLQDESWGTGYMDYPSMIQPILDRRCVSCHGGEQGVAGGLDLSGGWTELFNISYENLTARREKQYTADLIQGICCMNGTAYWSCKLFNAYEHGSGNAPLAAILLKEPHLSATGLTPSERELLFTWIDSNGLYFGTWNYTQTGAFAREYNAAKGELIGVMNEAGCVSCHADDQGNVKRFDDWINLENPQMSRILRAPLAESQTAESGFGLALCRNRKVNQNFSRLGLMFKSGYEHAVKNLDQFPTQVWQSWEESLKGEPVLTFQSTSDANYQKMRQIIEDARVRQLTNPRVDMPFANEMGTGIKAGRFRQIIPQPLPEKTPELNITVDADGIVRLNWECSDRTIGLVAELHRSTEPNFQPRPETLIGRTELFQFSDKNAPIGTVHYALVLVSDPAETCGTAKSGAVLDYTDSLPLSVNNLVHDSRVQQPIIKSIEGRCPLSLVEPLKSEPVWASITVPEPQPPTPPQNVRAVSSPGSITLHWEQERPGRFQYRVYLIEGQRELERQQMTLIGSESVITTTRTREPIRKELTQEPMNGNSWTIVPDDENEREFQVVAISRTGLETASPTIQARALPEKKEPVFVLADAVSDDSAVNLLKNGASFSKGELDVRNGGYMEIPNRPEFAVGDRFSFECSVKFDESGNMPIILGCGVWNQSGWFLQRIGAGFRLHCFGVDCDGGNATLGKWIRLVGTFDGTRLRLYQNGQLVAERFVVPNQRTVWTGPLLIGQYSGGISEDYQVKGRIKDVRFYERVLKP
ncbi:MAG: LamG-like jellyroll fold domain-containing protein [Thermoguttaceae bacterium]